ncbi:MAG: exodeoxyribonuclease V subunit alpha [Balneolaceae bacterium]|nr:exodeoxyribonuclease V subunit alpha [Balneolaceae bacterium]
MGNWIENLKRWKEQGAVSAISYHFPALLQKIDPETDEKVLLAAYLLVRRREEGHVCLDLSREAGQPMVKMVDDGAKPDPNRFSTPKLKPWIKAIIDSAHVGSPGTFKPMIWEDGRLYLQKYWRHEARLAAAILQLASTQTDPVDPAAVEDRLNRLFPVQSGGEREIDWQKVAALTSVLNRFSVISGGPGTGKTYTVFKILALLIDQQDTGDRPIRIALAAPTGKAADRITQAINRERERIDLAQPLKDRIPDEATTIHRLLGARRHTSTFKYNRDNPLPYDVIVIDEASMIDLALMSRVMDALPDNARLILLGDKDQLASVEAGAVLGSICRWEENRFSKRFIEKCSRYGIPGDDLQQADQDYPLLDNVVLLQESYRFKADSGIGNLSEAVRRGGADEALNLLKDESRTDIQWTGRISPAKLYDHLESEMLARFKKLLGCSSPDEALQLQREFQVLCAHNRGAFSVKQVNRMAEKLLRSHGLIPPFDEWYGGKPVMVTRNDYDLQLKNGDLGVALAETSGDIRVYFRGDTEYRSVLPARLKQYETAYGMSIHKSQGSEFEQILVVLPDEISPVVSRELIYTAVSRARSACTIFSPEEVLRQGTARKMERSSGLEDRLWGGAADSTTSRQLRFL